jgi:hypothetical protein
LGRAGEVAKTSLTALQRQHAAELHRVRHEADAAHAARESSWAVALEQAHAAAAVAAAAGQAQEAAAAAGPLLERVAALETGACLCLGGGPTIVLLGHTRCRFRKKIK